MATSPPAPTRVSGVRQTVRASVLVVPARLGSSLRVGSKQQRCHTWSVRCFGSLEEVLSGAKCSEFLPALQRAGIKSARELDNNSLKSSGRRGNGQTESILALEDLWRESACKVTRRNPLFADFAQTLDSQVYADLATRIAVAHLAEDVGASTATSAAGNSHPYQ